MKIEAVFSIMKMKWEMKYRSEVFVDEERNFGALSETSERD